MDLSLSLKGDYAVRAALSLARAWPDGGARKIREVSEEMALPLSYTPQILGHLAKAGLATAKAGRDGGYRLARAPKEITVLNLVEASEGPLLLGRCTLRGGPCRWDDACAVHHTWVAAAEAVRKTLAARTLADIVAEDRGLEAGERKRARKAR